MYYRRSVHGRVQSWIKHRKPKKQEGWFGGVYSWRFRKSSRSEIQATGEKYLVFNLTTDFRDLVSFLLKF